ncbi:hypothetical protein LCGC14_0446930 [marine sediment metagenome]|uniref:Uncharacterized protein n=1 Tax=marine sediment metagenome TaxID=412755 RepID=A0A0F9T272_9ZZZZ
MGFYAGSRFHNEVERTNGWGKFFGVGFTRHARQWERWFALFGRTFWYGWEA